MSDSSFIKNKTKKKINPKPFLLDKEVFNMHNIIEKKLKKYKITYLPDRSLEKILNGIRKKNLNSLRDEVRSINPIEKNMIFLIIQLRK